QAEDGIRDFHVTGVQTCALPISTSTEPSGRFCAHPTKPKARPCRCTKARKPTPCTRPRTRHARRAMCCVSAGKWSCIASSPSLALYWKEVVLDADSFSPPASPEGNCMTQPMEAGGKRGSGASPGWWRRNLPGMRALLAAYAGITIGVTLVALGLNWFLVPNRLAAGGGSGLAVVIYHLFNVPVGATMLAINIPLFALAAKVLGV